MKGGIAMHMLHCILVDLTDEIDDATALDAVEIKRLYKAARDLSAAATEDFSDEVFDWRRPTYSADRTEEDPDDGVVLGATDPERFRELLQEWAEAPYDGLLLAYSDVVRHFGNTPPTITEEMVRRWWKEYDSNTMGIYFLRKLLALADRVYRFESCFYSVPDESPKISKETLTKAIENPEDYALVFWNYHN